VGDLSFGTQRSGGGSEWSISDAANKTYEWLLEEFRGVTMFAGAREKSATVKLDSAKKRTLWRSMCMQEMR